MVLLDICVGEAYLVELIAEVYGVDVVALEVGEHDDLRAEEDKFGMRRDWKREDKGRTKKTMVKRRPAAIRTEKRKSHPGRANATGRVPECEGGRARATGSGDVSRGGDNEGGRVRTCATHCEIACVFEGEVVVFFVAIVEVISSSMAASA